MADGYWRTVHRRALNDTVRFAFDTAEKAVFAVIVAILGLLVIWLVGDASDTRGEFLARVGSTTAIVLLFPAMYMWRLLRTPSILYRETAAEIADLTRRLAEEGRAEVLQTEQIDATRAQLEFFKSLLGPAKPNIYDFAIATPVVAVSFSIAPGVDQYAIALQNILCEEKAELFLRLSTDHHGSLDKQHGAEGDYACVSAPPVMQWAAREIVLTPLLALEPPHGARLEIKLSHLAAGQGNAAIHFSSSGFQATAGGARYFAAQGHGSLLASLDQVRWVSVIVRRGNLSGGRVLGGPVLSPDALHSDRLPPAPDA